MKKLVLMLAVAFSMSFVACGNKEAAAEATEEVPAVEEVTETVAEEVAPVADSAAVVADTIVAAVAE